MKAVSGVGQEVALTEGDRSYRDPVWSPQGDEVAFVRRQQGGLPPEIVRVPMTGGPETRVATLSFGESSFITPGLDWSGDGQYLAFSDRDAEDDPQSIFVLSLKTGVRRQVSFPPTAGPNSYNDVCPAFSPDGTMLAFKRELVLSSGVGIIYVQSLNGDEPVGTPWPLNPGNYAPVWDLDWAENGEDVVYSNAVSIPNSKLMTVPVAGGEPSRLMVGERARYLSIASEGSRLVYSMWQDDNNIWRIGGPTSTEMGDPVKVLSSTWDDRYPTYSPDGDRVAFISDRDGTWEEWVANADGTEQRRLTDLGHAVRPRWHPDGDRLTFSSVSGGVSALYVIEAGGGIPTKLRKDEFQDAHPCWSDDGEWIYFMSQRAGDGPWEIWKMRAGQEDALQQVIPGGVVFPQFHNGRLYFTRRRRVWSTAPDGSDERLVVDARVNTMSSWQPWRDKIVYIRTIGPQTGTIEVFDLNTHQTQELAQVPGIGPFAGLTVSPDGQFIMYSSRDTAGSDIMLVENYRQE
jgi:Tol biopolymer transport system component